MLSVELAVGLPPEHYGTLRDKFANYFKRGSIQFVFNDTPICLMVQQVFVYPQAYAAVVPQAEKLRETPRTFVVDIGGYTTDVLLLRTTPAIFIGGGAALFRNFIESSPMVAHADFIPDQRANAIGYGMLANAQLSRMQTYNGGGDGIVRG